MSRPSEPFNAEERDLAQRLARLGGPCEPAAALDAIILAAARAAVSETDASAAAPITASAAVFAETPVMKPDPPVDPTVAPLRLRKPAPRWPVGFGLAASVVLAAGIGWRLQIDGDTHSEATSAPTAVLHTEAFHDEATEALILEPPLQRTPPPPPPPLENTEALARRADLPQAPAAKPAPKPREPEFVADAVAPQSVMAEAPPAPTAAAAAGSPAADAHLDEVTVTGSRIQRERTTGAAEYTRTPLNERREQAAQAAKSSPPSAAGPGRAASTPVPAPPPPPASSERARGSVGNVEGDAEERKARDSLGYDDRPPVSADSPEFRQAWLQRIRALIATGDHEAARGGLQEFRRRYPDLELPEDLRKMAATLPPPAP